MPFKRNTRLNPYQVEDRRGRRIGRGGGGMPIAVGGGGGIGILVLIAMFLINAFAGGGAPTGSSQIQNPGNQPAQGGTGSLAENCQTGEDANERDDCRIVGFVNSVQQYWSDEFARRGNRYTEATTVLFTDYVETGCGNASSEVGPFYCPVDRKIYLDLGFFSELRSRFGARGGGRWRRGTWWLTSTAITSRT